MDQSKIYFPNLNGLRFTAAFMVIIHHLEQLLSVFGFSNFWQNPIIKAIGGLGVELFFVLSGFLITYLLLEEENKTKTISIKDFYLRRILRIWPLYYTVGLLAFFILPFFHVFNVPVYSQQLTENFSLSLLLYLFFLPNLLLFGYGIVVPYASQSWSVGVEEQFYLIWPLLMKFFKNKLVLLFSVIIVYLFMLFFGFRIIQKYFFWSHEMDLLQSFWPGFKIHCMAIGALFSYCLFYKNRVMTFFLLKTVYQITLVILTVSIFFSLDILILNDVLFAIIILNLASTETKGVFLENKIMNYLGKISYGLYMYHVIVIVITIKCFTYFGWHNHFLLLFSVTSITIIFASISYYLIERKFILLKNRFSKVISGENAK